MVLFCRIGDRIPIRVKELYLEKSVVHPLYYIIDIFLYFIIKLEIFAFSWPNYIVRTQVSKIEKNVASTVHGKCMKMVWIK